jgi:hypothetical protein
VKKCKTMVKTGKTVIKKNHLNIISSTSSGMHI